MKVVVQANARVWGGNEKWLTMVALGLDRRGHEVIVSCKADSAVAERLRGRVRLTHARPGADLDLLHAAGFARMLRRERPDAVLLTSFKRSFWGGWAARRAGVARVVQRLGIELDFRDSWKYRHAFHHYIDALIVNSVAVQQRWLASAPFFPAHEVHVVLNGVEPVGEAPVARPIDLSVPSDARLIVAAGRLELRKGFDTLLDAFARLRDPAAHLAIAGDGPAAASLAQRAADAGVAERVHWLGFRADLHRIMAAADVFVHASRREGMANVVLEAMAASRLVVATDVAGVREALAARDGRAVAGWIVPPDDAAALAAALTDALGAVGSAGAEVIRAEARHRVTNWFSPERMIDQTETVLSGRSVQPSSMASTPSTSRSTV